MQGLRVLKKSLDPLRQPLNGLSLKGSKLSRGVKTILGFTDTR